MFKFFIFYVYFLRLAVKSDSIALIEDSTYVNCKERSCIIINSFKIPDNNSLSCAEDFLKIVFDYQLENKTKAQVEGFIIEGDTNILTNKQRFSKYCRKIRR